jgi:hypothetical protein
MFGRLLISCVFLFLTYHFLGINSTLQSLQCVQSRFFHTGPCDERVMEMAGQDVQNSLPETSTCCGSLTPCSPSITMERYETDSANPDNGTYYLNYSSGDNHGEVRYYYTGATADLDCEGLTHD